MADVVLAPAKLTRSLRVAGTRDDGFHLLDAEMVSVDLVDELTFEPTATASSSSAPRRTCPPTTRNLVRRALRRRRAHRGRCGSTSASRRAPAWAADRPTRPPCCAGRAPTTSPWPWPSGPTCRSASPAAGRGCGGWASWSSRCRSRTATFTLLTPPLHCSTAAVYRAWDDLGGPTAAGPNDLEPAALVVEPELARWRDRLGEATGQVPVLAGSGSTWFVEGAHPAPGHVVVRTASRRPTRDRRRADRPRRPVGGRDRLCWRGAGYLPAALRCQRVRFSIFLCFFLRMRLRRFLMSEPMRSTTVGDGVDPHAEEAARVLVTRL